MTKLIVCILFASFSINIAQTGSSASLIELQSQIKLQNSAEFNRGLTIQKELKKSAGLAIIYSLLLPGMGELYAGSYESGMYFTIADGMLWGTFAGFNIYGDWKADNYRAYAESFAGVDPDGKDDQYWAAIGNYNSIEEYNTEQELYRDFENVLDPGSHYWSWDSDSQRKSYRNTWSSSEQAYNNIRFAVGALIVNRLISAINAVRLVSAYNKSLSTELNWNLSLGVENNINLPSSLKLNFFTKF